MFNIHPAHAISTIVELLMIPNYDMNKGLLVTLDCEVSDCIAREGRIHRESERKNLFFLFLKATNYTTVWFDVKDFAEKGDKNWEHVCHHDSCWRDSVESKINKVYFGMCDRVKEKTGNDCAPKDLSSHCHFSIFQKPYFVNIEYEFIEDPNWPSRTLKMPTSISKWEESND